jgi:hypothetical protein
MPLLLAAAPLAAWLCIMLALAAKGLLALLPWLWLLV